MTPEQLDAEARELFSLCCDLDAENRELRRMMTQLVVWVWERRELSELAMSEIERRWPTSAANAA